MLERPQSGQRERGAMSNQGVLDDSDSYYVLSDHCYATKHAVELWLRVWSPTPGLVPAGELRPWLLWFHGGGYRAGNHYTIPPWISNLFGQRQYHIVCVGYRLTPCVDMAAIVEDCHDAWHWCHKNLGTVSPSCDTSSYAIGGSSAGGGLATLLARRIIDSERPPGAVICICGATDLVRIAKMHAARTAPIPPWTGSLSESQLKAIIQDHDPSHAVISSWLPGDTTAPLESKTGDEESCSGEMTLKRLWHVPDEAWKDLDRMRQQSDVNIYLGQQRQIVNAPLRLTDDTPWELKEAKVRMYSVVHLLEEQDHYPPTLLLHGADDVVVPVQSSMDLAERLRVKGIPVRERYIPGAGHGCFRPYKVGCTID